MDYYFFNGGGEMGSLIRATDWSKTDLGSPEYWSQTLRTMVSMILANPVGMCICWGTNNTIIYNDAFRFIFTCEQGTKSLGQSAGESLFKICPGISTSYKIALEGQVVTCTDLVLPTREKGDVEEGHFDVSYGPIQIETGAIGGVLITLKKGHLHINTTRDEEGDFYPENKANERFKQMAEKMPQKIWTADANGNRNYFNENMFTYTGLTFDELKDWGWEKIVHPDDWEKTKEKWEHAIISGEDFENENRLLRKDGIYLWHLVRAIPIKDDKGRPKMWIGSNTEIQQQVVLSEKLEQDLIRINAQMQTILQHAPDAVISIDEDGIVKSWNAESVNLFGWTESETLGKLLTETIIPERYREDHNRGMKRFLSTGEGPVINKPIELFALRKDGSEFPLELKISTSQIDNRYIFIAFMRDISERRHHQEIIQSKTNQLIEAQQLAHIGSWEWDVQRNIVSWSDELFRIFGLAPKEMSTDYETYLKFIHPDDREYVNSIVEGAFQDHQPYHFFHKVAGADGNIRIISATGKVFTDGSGKVIKMSGTGQDVTEQKNYEEQLRVSEERFYKIFDSNPIAMTLTEIQTNKIRYANSLFYKEFGYNESEVIGNSSEELNLIDPIEYERVVNLLLGYIDENRPLAEVQALSNEETEEILLKLKESKEMKDFEILYTRKDGTTFLAVVSFEIIKIGEQSYTVTSYHDITDRKSAQTLLQLQNEQLEKMNKELESFVYISSHDLQEPLRKIQTFVSIITEREMENLSENGKDKFKRIQNAAFRMQTLIQDLLAYSRTSKSKGHFEVIDLKSLINEVKDDLLEELLHKNATIDLVKTCNIKVIKFQFRQLIYNFFSNSIKFSSDKRALYIRIECVIRNGAELNIEQLSDEINYVHLSISDNGIGFDSIYSDKIFEMFQRLHSNSDYQGTGIGLTIIKKIVENHNGIVTASGELDKGALFDIYIPN